MTPTTAEHMTALQFGILMSIRCDPQYTPFANEYTEIQQMVRLGWLRRTPQHKYELTEAGTKKYLDRQTPYEKVMEENRRAAKHRFETHAQTQTHTTFAGGGGYCGHQSYYQSTWAQQPKLNPRPFRQTITIRPATRSLRPYVWTMERLERAAKEAEEERERILQEMVGNWD